MEGPLHLPCRRDLTSESKRPPSSSRSNRCLTGSRSRGRSSRGRKHHVRAVFRCAALVVLVGFYCVVNLTSRSGDGSGGSGGGRSIAVRPLRRTARAERLGRRLGEVREWLVNDGQEEKGGHRRLLLSEELENEGRYHADRQQQHAVGSRRFDVNGSARLTEARTEPQIQQGRRRATTAQKSCDEIKRAEPTWFLLWYIIGVLYMFLALAIVCDEFFVPALEEMASERRMNLSMDVAGATLMAAGGSAPELFTSLIGTFQESEVGIGTIVGSATFNVLFVIACCSLLSKEVLQLTWWPLFRDSAYYAVGLVVLAIFVGVVSVGKIELWEAIVLFVMYLGYVLVMAYNRKIYKRLTGKDLSALGMEEDEGGVRTSEDGEAAPAALGEAAEAGFEAEEEGGGGGGGGENGQEGAPRSSADGSPDGAEGGRPTLADPRHHRDSARSVYSASAPVDFRWPGTFRAGVLKLLRDPNSWLDTAGIGIVSKLAGDADHVFRTCDLNGDGQIDREELKHLFEKLDCEIGPEEMEDVFNQLDTDGNGMISETEFTAWYIRSEERIKLKVKETFDTFDEDCSGTIDRDEVRKLLERLEPRVTEQDVHDAMDAMYKDGSTEEITFDEFAEWYMHSLIYEHQKKLAVEELEEGACENLNPPYGEGCGAWAKYILVLPLVVTLTFTVPDVSRPGWSKWCYLSFVVSIGWIGVYSFFMVDWAETIGNTIGIPSVVMGLTFLAAGTSVPDLLSSVIVARKGEGDMAVSSSIGSNIFDILVGLPVPWIIYTAWPTKPSTVTIGADNIWISIFVLLGMLVLIIVVIHFQKWRLTKKTGFAMFFLYIIFLVQAIVLELPFQVCVPSAR